MNYRISLVLYLQIASLWTAPVQIIQAKPQVMMHTLQQPSPIETLQSLKAQKLHQDLQTSTRLQQIMIANIQQQMATNTLQKLAQIQAMQFMKPNTLDIEPNLLTPTWMPQMFLETTQSPIMIPGQQEMPEQQQPVIPMIQQMTEEAMQEIALQQQMLTLQQMQLNTVHSPYTFPQPEPVLILLPDEKTANTHHKLYKNTNENGTKEDELKNQGEKDEVDSIILESQDELEPISIKGTRKAILFIPNARLSIGGVISQIPWLPIEVNVPDTAIWAWNGIYNGISSIISIIGSRLPWRPRPQESPGTKTLEPSIKAFLKSLQKNNYDDYGPVIPAYPMEFDPLNTVIPVHFNN